MDQTLEKMTLIWEVIAKSQMKIRPTKRGLKCLQLLLLLKESEYNEANSNRIYVSYFRENTQVDLSSCELFTTFLPQIGKDIISGIATGKYQNNSVFSNPRYGRQLPSLFDDLLSIFFTKKGNYIAGSEEHISLTLQLFMTFYKYEQPFSDFTLEKAKAKFIEDDASVKNNSWPLYGGHSIFNVRRRFRAIFPDDPWDIRPHHSNGSTNTKGINNLLKRTVTRYNHKIMSSPYGQYFCNNNITHEKNDDHLYSRITFVPKDSRGPRTISMEPHERMYLQKGLLAKIVEFQENNCFMTKGYVNYTDQSINQSLAYKASIDGRKATIDLKDASDMVSWVLIKTLASTEWSEAYDILRSDKVFIDNQLISINKFASMGSALCFPVLASVIFSIASCYDPKCYVYGDDLICDASLAPQIMIALEDYGLKINKDKSFLSGPFRESCGGDFVSGVNVSYIKCKSLQMVPYVEFCNLITEKYNSTLGDSLIAIYESYNNPVFRIPFFEETRAGCYKTEFLSSNDVFFKRRYNKDLQHYEYYFFQPSVLDLDAKSMKNLLKKKKYISRKNNSPYGPYIPMEYKPSHYYYEWLTLSFRYNSMSDFTFDRSSSDLFPEKKVTLFRYSNGVINPVIPGIIKFGKDDNIALAWGNIPSL